MEQGDVHHVADHVADAHPVADMVQVSGDDVEIASNGTDNLLRGKGNPRS